MKVLLAILTASVILTGGLAWAQQAPAGPGAWSGGGFGGGGFGGMGPMMGGGFGGGGIGGGGGFGGMGPMMGGGFGGGGLAGGGGFGMPMFDPMGMMAAMFGGGPGVIVPGGTGKPGGGVVRPGTPLSPTPQLYQPGK